MICSHCKTNNEADARFCGECGRPLADPMNPVQGRKRSYWPALLLIPVLAAAIGLGYYKFFLPQGVAAEVNGEVISLSELDAATSRVSGDKGQFGEQLRGRVLQELIMEKLLLQEAHKSGVRVERAEVQAAVAAYQASSGLERAAFVKNISVRYGSEDGFEKEVSRSLLIEKFLNEKFMTRGGDRRSSQITFDRWFETVWQNASVRIALASQGDGGCGGCNRSEGRSTPCGGGPAGTSAPSAGAPKTAQAAEAALDYWHKTHGNANVAAKVQDFGCHMQIDIVQGQKIIGSLQYRGGQITEMGRN
ncbi:MAG TPA: SurA N-terminal domain-containing protein [Nitrospirota bacterium]|nr:SurA N-terminal domain-containing protein [Nitrospirota bacterium]